MIFESDTKGCGRMATQFSSCCSRFRISKGVLLNSRLNESAMPIFFSSASMVYSGVPPSP